MTEPQTTAGRKLIEAIDGLRFVSIEELIGEVADIEAEAVERVTNKETLREALNYCRLRTNSEHADHSIDPDHLSAYLRGLHNV